MRIGRWIVAAILCAALSGCEVVKESNARVLGAKLIDVETVVDPETGVITKLSHWRYDDGVEVTTTDRFKKDTPVEQRRATSRAPLRTVEIP